MPSISASSLGPRWRMLATILSTQAILPRAPTPKIFTPILHQNLLLKRNRPLRHHRHAHPAPHREDSEVRVRPAAMINKPRPVPRLAPVDPIQLPVRVRVVRHAEHVHGAARARPRRHHAAHVLAQHRLRGHRLQRPHPDPARSVVTQLDPRARPAQPGHVLRPAGARCMASARSRSAPVAVQPRRSYGLVRRERPILRPVRRPLCARAQAFGSNGFSLTKLRRGAASVRVCHGDVRGSQSAPTSAGTTSASQRRFSRFSDAVARTTGCTPPHSSPCMSTSAAAAASRARGRGTRTPWLHAQTSRLGRSSASAAARRTKRRGSVVRMRRRKAGASASAAKAASEPFGADRRRVRVARTGAVSGWRWYRRTVARRGPGRLWP